MPVMRNRHRFIKIYRPPGTRIAEGKFEMPGYRLLNRVAAFGPAVQVAIDRAFAAFVQEFRCWPDFSRMIIETSMVDGVARATIVEIPDDD